MIFVLLGLLPNFRAAISSVLGIKWGFYTENSF